MSFLTVYVWGARLWIWLMLIFSMLSLIGIVAYFFREKILEKFHKARSPEKVIKIVLHYPGRKFRAFWRLIPQDGKIKLGNEIYPYEASKAIHPESMILDVTKDPGIYLATIGGNKYTVDENLAIKARWESWPEIHFPYGIPEAIDFGNYKGEITFTAEAVKALEKNDLWDKLINMQGEKTMQMLMIILLVAILLCSGFVAAKQGGLIK